ncbi:MAG: peptidyl-prolyl cis-trans isomerase [Alphaproteobacteria bacterium]|nr:peptidyl-prolyl cis-trans isomerase [Alphaproteobacteria bacterium]MBE8220524.1 peptidyl-prolyl cis-trans isomerase [Alphaproteobacteria bacterium]
MNTQDKLAQFCLILAAVAGLVVALGLGQLFTPPLQEAGAIAFVNDSRIERSEYGVAYQALLADKSKIPTSGDKRLALDRLLEEELLVQRGLEIGLVDSDTSVRKAIAAAVIEFVLVQNKQDVPSENELRDFYNIHKARFAPADRLQIARIFIRNNDDATTRIGIIRQALQAGTNFIEVQKMGDEILPPLPRVLLPRQKMYDYIGPALTDTALRMQAGEISDALFDGNGWHFLYVVDVQGGTAPAFADIRAQIITALIRHRDDQALRDYLDWLRTRADIVLAPDAPQ